ncbi:MAG: sulfur oxidation c-type cytochrome SoxA [Candidatus Obscuribacterales bacterium]|nr:sulfur oxidation c-type cytochrome SoxA [Steroidobacteraceae bacterium]
MPKRAITVLTLACSIAVYVCCEAQSSASPPKSGFDFLTPETQRLQNDEFANPGMLWIDIGMKLWKQTELSTGKSCESCHAAVNTMHGVAARFPKHSSSVRRVINLEQQINLCRTDRLKSKPWAYESQELLAITALVSHESKGELINVTIDGQAAASFERGRRFFYQRRGQLNLSCANCHEQNAGKRLHGETISQGQTSGFPIYRQLWQTLASSHRMFAWCNEATRAEPYPLGSQEYVDLELYERWRGRGLKLESPAVRR